MAERQFVVMERVACPVCGGSGTVIVEVRDSQTGKFAYWHSHPCRCNGGIVLVEVPLREALDTLAREDWKEVCG